MSTWQQTTSSRKGAYLRLGPNELYVRQDGGGWAWYLDGQRGGAERGEAPARAAAEAAVRAMSRTHTGAMAAPARKAG